LYIAAEGIPVVKFATRSCIANAVGLLIATYYVFNIMYPVKGNSVDLFLESALLGNANKKRVAVNIFLAALSK
jgi:3D (Asp-Asp-Asp) domain-containing protein